MTGYNDYRLRVTPEIDYENFGLADVLTVIGLVGGVEGAAGASARAPLVPI